MKLSIVMPAYNEEERIGSTLADFSSFFESIRKNSQLSYQILVVINNTTDNTLSIVQEAKKKNPRISYINLPKGGKGYAVIEGFKHALDEKYDLIGFVDADNATIPSEFYKLVTNIDGFDSIIASRYIKGSVVNPRQGLKRIISSRVFNALIRSVMFLNIKDTQCGAKLFKSHSLRLIIPKITMSQWAFDVELLYLLKKNKMTIKEVPTVWSDNKYSKLNFMKAGPKMVLGILRLRIINSPFKSLVRIYDSVLGKS
jgi:glycosyltransferase involved in cell wall biosynthesis